MFFLNELREVHLPFGVGETYMKNERNMGEIGAPNQPKENANAQNEKGDSPDLRVVQPEVQLDGTTKFKSVGGLWKNVSKNGNEFYTLKIGKLKLLVFQNDRDKFSGTARGADGETNVGKNARGNGE